MKRIILSCVVALTAFMFPFCNQVQAELVELNWNNAINMTDGTPIPATGTQSLQSTKLYWGVCDPATNQPQDPLSVATVATTVPGSTGSYTVEIAEPGDYCFFATHLLEDNTESDPSNVAIKTVVAPPPQPEPPQGLVVVESTAYTVIKQENRFVLLPVGTVPEGTPCIETQTINGKYAVDRAQVDWSGNIQPMVVVASCGGS